VQNIGAERANGTIVAILGEAAWCGGNRTGDHDVPAIRRRVAWSVSSRRRNATKMTIGKDKICADHHNLADILGGHPAGERRRGNAVKDFDAGKQGFLEF